MMQGGPTSDGGWVNADVIYSVEEWNPAFNLSGAIVTGKTYTLRCVFMKS
jgi:hypothetical protein